jgi:ABC-type transporter Mla subunit MlaD
VATRGQKTKVGIFLVICLAIMTGTLTYTSGLYKEEGVDYYIEFNESVLGVLEGGVVEYLGVPVGKVTDITVTQNNRARVSVSIDPYKILLRDGVEAQIVIYSIAAGTMAISLSGGDKGNNKVVPRELTLASEGPDDSSYLRNVAEKLLEGFEEYDQDKNSWLTLEEVRKAVPYVSPEEFSELDSEPAPALPRNSQIPTKASIFTTVSVHVTTLMENLNQIAQSINAGLSGMDEGEIAAVVENVNTTLADASEFIAAGKSLVEQTNETVLGMRSDVQGLISNVEGTSTDIRILANDADDFVKLAETKLDQFDVEETTAQLNQMLEQLTLVSKRIDSALAQFDAMSANVLHEADNVEHNLRSTLHEISEAFESMGGFLGRLTEDPSALVRGAGTKKETIE